MPKMTSSPPEVEPWEGAPPGWVEGEATVRTSGAWKEGKLSMEGV